MRKFVAVVVIAIAGSIAAAFVLRSTPPAGGPARLQVAATIFPLADWLREVGGPDVDARCLVSGYNNPHHFEPAIQDATRLSQARALFAVGLGLDEWAEKLAANSGRGDKLAFFETGAWITPRRLECHDHESSDQSRAREQADDHHHGEHDPHFWLDPQRAVTVVLRLGEELGKLDPPRAGAYRVRAAAYAEKLRALDAELAVKAHAMPPGRKIVTFHDAYGYLLERLGVKIVAVVQASPGVEPGTRDVTDAIRTMREIGQRAVFYEPMGSKTAAEAVAREMGAQLLLLDPLDSELSEAGNTYLERMRHDIGVLAKAFAP